MSQSEPRAPADPPAARRRRVFRPGFPQVVLTLAALALLAARAWPSGRIEEQHRNVAYYAIVLAALVLLTGWLLIFSRVPRWATLLAVALGGGLVLYGFLGGLIGFDGDMGMLLRSPWGADPQAVLEEHRQRAGGAGGPADLAAVLPGDWPGFRGPRRDGVVREGPPLARDWQARPPRRVWEQPVGGGFGSFAVVNGFAVTLEQRRDDEAVVCYDAATGEEVWAYRYPARFNDIQGGDGPRSTPAVYDGDVFSFGATGRLVCLDGRDGSPKWEVNTLEGNENLPWGLSGSPLVFDDLVVVNPGAQRPGAEGRALVAYDRRTGEVVWAAGRAPAGYSSPMLATLAGKRQVLVFDGEGLAGYDPAGGGELWRFPWRTQQGINVAQPVVVGDDRVFIASGYGEGGALVRVAQSGGAWGAEQVWRTRNTVMRCKFASPVAHGGHLYGLNDGKLECVDLATGEAVWKDDRRAREGEAYGHGQLLLADGLLVVLTEFGELVLVEAAPEELRELGRVKVLEGIKTWNNPALAGGRVYVRNAERMACYDLRAE